MPHMINQFFSPEAVVTGSAASPLVTTPVTGVVSPALAVGAAGSAASSGGPCMPRRPGRRLQRHDSKQLASATGAVASAEGYIYRIALAFRLHNLDRIKWVGVQVQCF